MRASHVVKQEQEGWRDLPSLHYGKRHAIQPRELYLHSSSGPIGDTADHLVPLSILTAMVNNEPLHIEGPVSPKLMASLRQAQGVLKAFTAIHGHDLSEVEVTADSVAVRDWPSGRGGACFFSGGVDSTYSALTRRDELDALVFIHGYDLDVRDEQWRAMAAERVRGAAAAIGLPLIEIETNMSPFIGRQISWPIAHGTALATVALLLQPMFSRFYFSGGRAITQLTATGCHPMLDPLWSTEGLDVIHCGGEAERWQKIKYLADNEIAQKHLRLCFDQRHSPPYNCGECGKCVTTMATLAALGVLDKFQVFAKPLNLETVARLDASNPAGRVRIEDTLAILDGPDGKPFPELREALISSLETWVKSLNEPRKAELLVGSTRASNWPGFRATES